MTPSSKRVRREATPDPTDPTERQAFEQSLLAGDVRRQFGALLEASGISQRELASRLDRRQPQISKLLRAENMELTTVADLFWALGYRLDVQAVAVDRRGTPALDDPAPPKWVRPLGGRVPQRSSQRADS